MGIKKTLKKIKDLERKAAKVAKVAKAVENFAKAPARNAGRAIGKKLGSQRMGQAIGSAIGKITGTGDYYVRSNNILRGSSLLSTDAVPQFTRANAREVRVRHREYLGKVVASSTAGEFKIQKFAVNPGVQTTFPWLNVIANQYDEWRPNGVVFVYKNMSSKWSGTSTLGTVCIASDYDVLDPTYTNEIEMNNSEFAVSTNVASNIAHPLECEVRERPTKLLFTRNGDIQDTDNLRWFDLANTYVATYGCTESQICGELWVTYDISFFKTQITSSPSNTLLTLSGASTTTLNAGDCIQSAFLENPIGPLSEYIVKRGEDGITATNPSVLYPLTFLYQVLFSVAGTSLVVLTGDVGVTSSSTGASYIDGSLVVGDGALAYRQYNFSVNTTTLVSGFWCVVLQVAPGRTVDFNFGILLQSGTVSSHYVIGNVIQVPDTGLTGEGYAHPLPLP